MRCFFTPKGVGFLLKKLDADKSKHFLVSGYSTVFHNQVPLELQEICKVVSSSIGSLDDLESSLNGFRICLTSAIVNQIIDCCKHEAPTRSLLRFFLWSNKRSDFDTKDEDFNHAIRVLAEKKDHTAMQILISDLRKEGRVMEPQTFGLVAENLVKLGREDDALGIFKNLDKFNCSQDGETVTAMISALCAKGLARKAYGVFWHHKDKISEVMKPCVYRSLIYGWSVQKNVKEARKVIQEMKGDGVMPDLFSFNTFLKCLCEGNVLRNPSGLVPESLNVMMEMRTYKIEPNSNSYNILLSCLGRVRRVQESCRILESMKKSGCDPDWVSYYLVVKLLYITGRFGKGNKTVDEMIEMGLVPDRKFYYDLIGVLCGVERVNFALELFERMKRNSLGGYGPVYDVLIPKLCRGGNFDKGKELWDEAMAMGVTLHCSNDVLDPLITKVFKPTRKVEEEVRLQVSIAADRPKTRVRVRKTKRKRNKKMARSQGARKRKDRLRNN
ncbi:pentatricopeptide repeat-containing protein At5g61370, mitochondrial [Mercurialis annua]|uniref:pentatricopeptide repeat-containing protein At5g61370, mitochondrial n=1 Tax=Mercurialis annua TaxID=3986 RepID=UPI00215F8CF8|nr:pentatricopeptide repeat-containing protein At5g61370, mitochondrial [Mercurialis annua]XP_050224783.1 pentatricopeptide repeat-containing protein At5g61370, mitochondrial [Mercurialis annua]